MGELAGAVGVGAAVTEDGAGVAPAGREGPCVGGLEVLDHNGGGELRPEADGLAGGVEEGEHLRGEFSAGLAQEEVSGLEDRDVDVAVAERG